jgi:type IV secretory pathway VirB10-like protein
MFSRWNIFGRKDTTVVDNTIEQITETMEVRGSGRESVPIQEKEVINTPKPTPIKKRAPSRRKSEAHSRRKTITPKKKVIKSRRKTLQPALPEKDKKVKGQSTARDLRRVKRELKREEFFKNLKLERLEKELIASKRKLRELAEKEQSHHERDEDIDMDENQGTCHRQIIFIEFLPRSCNILHSLAYHTLFKDVYSDLSELKY